MWDIAVRIKYFDVFDYLVFSSDLAVHMVIIWSCARKIINLFIINANDSNCKETQTFPYCTVRSGLGNSGASSLHFTCHEIQFHSSPSRYCQSNGPDHLSLYVLSSLDTHLEPATANQDRASRLWECGARLTSAPCIRHEILISLSNLQHWKLSRDHIV